jgi:hypothetical protein
MAISLCALSTAPIALSLASGTHPDDDYDAAHVYQFHSIIYNLSYLES